MNDMSIWSKINGFDRYEVSRTGQVRNTQTARELKGRPSGAGYLQVSLGAGIYRYIHRLVAKSFIENPRDLPQVNHIDGNKTNNQASNLEWVTASENLRHAYATGLLDGTICKNPMRGAEHWKSTPVTLSSDCGHIQITYPSMRNAANELGIDYSTIHGAIHGKFKQAGGWLWKLASQTTSTQEHI